MGALRKESQDTGEIKRMRVHPDFQKRGFGQKILTLLEKKAKGLGYKKLILDTTEIQIHAQNFYKKNRYKEISRRFISRLNLENIHYEKFIV